LIIPTSNLSPEKTSLLTEKIKNKLSDWFSSGVSNDPDCLSAECQANKKSFRGWVKSLFRLPSVKTDFVDYGQPTSENVMYPVKGQLWLIKILRTDENQKKLENYLSTIPEYTRGSTGLTGGLDLFLPLECLAKYQDLETGEIFNTPGKNRLGMFCNESAYDGSCIQNNLEIFFDCPNTTSEGSACFRNGCFYVVTKSSSGCFYILDCKIDLSNNARITCEKNSLSTCSWWDVKCQGSAELIIDQMTGEYKSIKEGTIRCSTDIRTPPVGISSIVTAYSPSLEWGVESIGENTAVNLKWTAQKVLGDTSSDTISDCRIGETCNPSQSAVSAKPSSQKEDGKDNIEPDAPKTPSGGLTEEEEKNCKGS